MTATAKKAASPKVETPTTDPRWDALAAPFPAEDIEKLPKPLRRNDDNKARCEDTPAGRRVSADGHYCNGWHSRAMHLDYVGHAGITMRLNEVVGPEGWSLEPFALTPDGLPMLARGEFWVKLTILGVTKWEVAANFNSTQEAVGDALRRAAMRFGVGTYLWSKSDRAHSLATFAEPEAPAPAAERQGGTRQQGQQAPAPQGQPDGAVVRAHVIAATKATDLEALRETWQQAVAAGTFGTPIVDPDATDRDAPQITLGEFLTRKRTELEQAAAA